MCDCLARTVRQSHCCDHQRDRAQRQVDPEHVVHRTEFSYDGGKRRGYDGLVERPYEHRDHERGKHRRYGPARERVYLQGLSGLLYKALICVSVLFLPHMSPFFINATFVSQGIFRYN